ncbi:MAG: hypothetical protein Q8L86_18215 [Vicinamibacterales bacterium]|nr:hypothetical protein [Vicinamibacterales bacterium]
MRDAFVSSDHDAVGLRSGVFAEVVLRLLQEQLTGTHIPFGSRLPTFDAECLRLQNLPKTAGHESLRLVIPRALVFLYTIRNKRGIGHAGGEVEANAIDAATCVRVSDWCLCELLRMYHSLSLEEAQSLLDAIAVRAVPVVWLVNGRKRVLDTSLDYRSQALVLVYSSGEDAVLEEDLRGWIEYPQVSRFRERVLKPLHSSRLIEWDRELGTVSLSPTGVREVETRILV